MCFYGWLALSASTYVVFKADESVSAVVQPIGIGQCLRLTPKKLSPIRSSLKKKRSNSLISVFSKKHVQLAFYDMSTFQLFQPQALESTSFLSCSSSSYSSWRSLDFTLSFLDAATRERDWLVSRGSLTTWRDQLLDEIPNTILEQCMSFMSFIDVHCLCISLWLFSRPHYKAL